MVEWDQVGLSERKDKAQTRGLSTILETTNQERRGRRLA